MGLGWLRCALHVKVAFNGRVLFLGIWLVSGVSCDRNPRIFRVHVGYGPQNPETVIGCPLGARGLDLVSRRAELPNSKGSLYGWRQSFVEAHCRLKGVSVLQAPLPEDSHSRKIALCVAYWISRRGAHKALRFCSVAHAEQTLRWATTHI